MNLSDWWPRLRERPAQRPKRAPCLLRLELLEDRTLLSFRPVSYLATTLTNLNGIFPHCLATGDFNGDGKPDLISSARANSASLPATSFSVLLNAGYATFQTPRVTQFDTPINVLATADVNGDGKSDLLYGTYFPNGNFGVLLSNGDGTFLSGGSYGTVALPTAIVAGDFNGDGNIDVATGNTYYSNAMGLISVFMGNGDGTFKPAVTYAGTSRPSALAVGDFNGDGNLDLVGGGYDQQSNLILLIGNGDGTFQAPLTMAGQPSDTLGIGDFNKDGKADIVFGSTTSGFSGPLSGMGVFLGNGNGTFGPAQMVAPGVPVVSLGIGDLSGQGSESIVGVAAPPNNDRNANAVVLSANGDGTFASPSTFLVGVPADFRDTVVLADFYGDGTLGAVFGPMFDGYLVLTLYSRVPTITDFSPEIAPPGMSVTITGTDFFDVSAVAFNGVSTSNYVVTSPTSLTVVVPAGATTGPIGIAARGGVGQSAAGFTIGSPPAPPLFLVTNTRGSGTGSLRNAVDQANTAGGSNTILFSSAIAGQTITLAGELDIAANDDLTIQGDPSLGITISGNGSQRLFAVTAGGSLTLEDMTLENGLAQGGYGGGGYRGGGGGDAGMGGAVFNEGTLTIERCTLTNNSAVGGSGGAGGAGYGDGGYGAAYGFGGAGGSGMPSIVTNGAGGGGGGGAGLGGAIFNHAGTVVITNSTLTANSVRGGGGGAGGFGEEGYAKGSPGGSGSGAGDAIFNYNGSLTLTNDTAGGVYSLGDGSGNTAAATINNTIAGSFTGATINSGASTTSGVGNLIRTASGFSGTIVSSADPQLGALADNGGPTPTMFPASGSPAIAAGDNNAASGLTTDQRGYGPRIPLNGTVDIGAVQTTAVSPNQKIFVTGADAGGGPDVRVFDAITHQQLFAFFPFDAGFTGGVRVAVGDVNGDGFQDIICAAGPGGGPDVVVFSGKDASFLFRFFAFNPLFTGGVNVGAGDVNGDGFTDIICGAAAGGGPNVAVYSGKGQAQTLLTSFFAYDLNFTGGVRVAGADVNDDGFADVICGAGPGGGPNITVYSGQDNAHTLLFSFFAYDPSFTAGIYVAGGDFNGDGHADIMAGAGAGGGPNVTVFSGLDATRLASFFAFDPNFIGGVRVGPALQANGLAALIAVEGPQTNPQNGSLSSPNVRIFKALSGVLLDEFFAVNPAFTGGLYVAGSE